MSVSVYVPWCLSVVFCLCMCDDTVVYLLFCVCVFSVCLCMCDSTVDWLHSFLCVSVYMTSHLSVFVCVYLCVYVCWYS